MASDARHLVGQSGVVGLLSAAREGSAQAPPHCPSLGCSLHAKDFPQRRAMRRNVSLRRKGFEFTGARHRTVWVGQLMENFWKE